MEGNKVKNIFSEDAPVKELIILEAQKVMAEKLLQLELEESATLKENRIDESVVVSFLN